MGSLEVRLRSEGLRHLLSDFDRASHFGSFCEQVIWNLHGNLASDAAADGRGIPNWNVYSCRRLFPSTECALETIYPLSLGTGSIMKLDFELLYVPACL